MSIEHMKEKIKPFYTLIIILFIALIFFGLGRLSALEGYKNPIKIEYPDMSQAASVINAEKPLTNTPKAVPTAVKPTEQVIGSKSGKKYYFPWCGTVKRIKPENQVHFASIAEAKQAGFVAGGNCKGLE
jgi:hypothetical protein